MHRGVPRQNLITAVFKHRIRTPTRPKAHVKHNYDLSVFYGSYNIRAVFVARGLMWIMKL